MDCPHCRVLMSEGSCRIHGTLFGFLAVGVSYMKLFFTDAISYRKVEVLQPWVMQKSHYCPRCGSLVIKGDLDPDGDIACLGCGAVIPAGQSTCEKCGWTFEA